MTHVHRRLRTHINSHFPQGLISQAQEARFATPDEGQFEFAEGLLKSTPVACHEEASPRLSSPGHILPGPWPCFAVSSAAPSHLATTAP